MEPTTEQTMSVIIISIVISGLIVRSIIAILEAIGIYIEEIIDEDYRDEYHRGHYYFMSAFLITIVSAFVILLIYEGYVIGYIDKLKH